MARGFAVSSAACASSPAYVDVKSPYAYLALAPTRALCAEHGVAFDWLPYVLDIPSYLGSAWLARAPAAQVRAQLAHDERLELGP